MSNKTIGGGNNIKSCYDLSPLGVNNVGYSRHEALNKLVALESQGIPILGGDVFILKGEKISLTYDNWYCNLKNEESKTDFVARSCKVAYDYIRNYKNANTEIVIFSLVY